MKRILGLALWIALAYLFAGVVYIAPNTYVLATHWEKPHYGNVVALFVPPGFHWIDPTLTRGNVVLKTSEPSYVELLRAYRYAVAKRNAVYGEQPDFTEDNARAILPWIASYINRHKDAIYRPVTIREIKAIDLGPDLLGQYQPVLLDKQYNLVLDSNKQPIPSDLMLLNSSYLTSGGVEIAWLNTLVHETIHSAYVSDETATQILTLEVLWEMKQDGWYGAEYAFWDMLAKELGDAVYWKAHYGPITPASPYEVDAMLQQLRPNQATEFLSIIDPNNGLVAMSPVDWFETSFQRAVIRIRHGIYDKQWARISTPYQRKNRAKLEQVRTEEESQTVSLKYYMGAWESTYYAVGEGKIAWTDIYIDWKSMSLMVNHRNDSLSGVSKLVREMFPGHFDLVPQFVAGVASPALWQVEPRAENSVFFVLIILLTGGIAYKFLQRI